jgi:glycosyltransferase involved in cell wall biosynthesis
LSAAHANLFYVVDWLPPVFGAVGQYGMLSAQNLAFDGRHVYLIGLTNKENSRTSKAVGAGILEIVIISAASYDKSRLIKRLAWTLRTNARLLWEVIRRPESRGADLLFTGSPPFFLYFAVLAKFIRRVRLIYRITDFYPEVIIADRGNRSPLLAPLQRLTWFMRRQVDMFEVLGEDQRGILLRQGIPLERIVLKRDVSPVVFSGHERPLPRPKELNGLAVLLYSGNYGVPHDVDTVVEGFIRHRQSGSGRTGLWLNATGANADQVEARLRPAAVPCARSTTVPLDQLAALLVSGDAHLITLRCRAARAASCLHATSRQEYQDIRAFGLKAPIAIIPNGIDVLPSEPKGPPNGGQRTVLYLGRLHPKKGLDRLLDAWELIEDHHPEWQLDIVGPIDGDYAQMLKARIAADAASRVCLVGPLYGEAKLEAYRRADLFVLPTLNENFAMTVAEALAQGTPVISTKGAPWAGLVSYGCGWWIDHGTEPLAAAMDEAMSISRAQLASMGEAGRAWMCRDFNWTSVAASMQSVYHWLSGRGERPSCVVMD